MGLFGPPCARWLVLGAVVSLVASLAAAAVVGVCVRGARAACVLSPGLVAVLGLYGGPFLYFIYFIFEFFKEGSPSAEAVFQGALR